LGNASESPDIMNGDLLVKVVVENSNLPEMKRVGDDLEYDLKLNLTDAIFGAKKEIKTLEGKNETIEIKPGSQFDDKVVFKERVKNYILKQFYFTFFNLGIFQPR
jgi:DnaJ-class molecular chaperone